MSVRRKAMAMSTYQDPFLYPNLDRFLKESVLHPTATAKLLLTPFLT
jgi:hypothetical protein